MKGKGTVVRPAGTGYNAVLADVVRLIEAGRSAASRSVNAVMTATYWGIGRRIVKHEQGGKRRAEYGAALIERLAADLTAKCGRGFGKRNLFQMRAFYLAYPEIVQTPSAQSTGGHPDKVHTVSAQSAPVAGDLPRFPLPWSHYVRLLAVTNPRARHFYEQEALRGGWTIKQLDRQIGSQYYERTALSRNKAAMLRKGQALVPGDVVLPEEQIKDPYILEFADLKDEYSETELRLPWSPSSRASCSSSEATSRSLDGSGDCASATSGTGSTSCSSTAASGAWSSST